MHVSLQSSLALHVAHFFTDIASTEDPTELSFKKGETLEILTNSDLWWEARKADGTKGS